MASTPNDPFAKPVLFAGLALLAAALFVLVSNLLHTIQKNSTIGSDDSAMIEIAAQNNLAPIGTVIAVDKSVAPVARSGEAIYNAVCTACHASGVLGAPKLEQVAWTARAAKGLESLLNNAINGFNQMPARGGDPSITDEEMKSAVLYMTAEAGLDLTGGAKSADAAGDKTAATSTVETEETETTETKQAAAKPEPEQKAAESEPTQAAAKPEPAQELTVSQAPEQATIPAEPKAVEAKTEETPAEPVAEATPVEPETATSSAEPVAETAAKAETASAVQSSIDGQKIYKSICFSCHDFGVAAAPKPGDKATWAPRLANGMDILYESSLNGKGAMPAKGGNSALSDDEVKAAVDWMVAESK